MSGFNIYNIDKGDFFVKTRTIFLYGEINAATAYDVGCRLKYLDFIDSNEPITIEINSPGGEVSSGLAIIDTMKCISAPVKVIVCGMAASIPLPPAQPLPKSPRTRSSPMKICLQCGSLS